MFSRNRLATLVAEFVGTFVLTSVVLGMIIKISIPFFAAASAGATLALMVLIIGNISGAHINPAVTFGFWSARKIQTLKAIMYISVQLLGGLCAILFAQYLLNQDIPNQSGGTAIDWRVFTAEMVGTFIFTAGIAASVSQKLEGGKLAGAIGMSLFVGLVVASMGSNGILNPAVAIGINSVNVNYMVAPLIGGLLGFNLYEYIFNERNKTTRLSGSKSTKNKKTNKKK